MAIDRRRFVLGGALAPLLAAAGRAAAPLYAAPCVDDDGSYALRAFDAAGGMAWSLPLPSRGHGLVGDGDRLAVFARRPGSWGMLASARNGAVRARLQPPDGFTFNGHGAFSADGRLLFTTATRQEDDSGWLIVLDGSDDWRAAAEWRTGGRDPHELLRLGDDLIVANGGLPDGRRAKDPREVDTSLAWIDARSGELRNLQRPPEELRRVSLRHMTIMQGRVFVVGQDQGSSADRLPLLAMSDGRRLAYVATPPLDGYCGGVAGAHAALCVTGPRAGRAYVLEPPGAVRARCEMPDVCGVAPTAGGFLLTSGRGEIRSLPSGAAAAAAGLHWDNHAIRLPA